MHMKTAVVFKWCRDPQDAHVMADGRVNWGNAKMAASDDDPAAMDVARSLSEEADIVGVTVGDGKPEWAAARGAASTVSVGDYEYRLDGNAAASAVKAAIEKAGGVDVVAIGDSDWDRSVPLALAAKLGWPAYFDVTGAEAKDGKVALTCKGVGESRVIETPVPVLVVAKALESEQNVPGMKQTLAARKKPLDKTTMADLGVAGEAKAESAGTHVPEGDPCVMIDGEDPQAAAEQLIGALRGEGLL